MSKDKKLFYRRSREKYLTAFMLGFGCMLLSLIPFMIAEKGYFIYYGDYNAQQIPFYQLANDTVRSGQFGWNWYTDLGSDFMTSYSFYLFGSPFFWLSVLVPRSLVAFSMSIILAIKHGVASVTAYAYIRRFVRRKSAALTGGLLYAFSGFQIYNVFFNHFQDVTALFPLMLIAMEENINCRRKGVFALSVGLMALVNYYFFTGQCVFLVIYYLIRMKAPDFHTSWKKFFGLAFEAVAGTMLAGFVLLPSALAIMTNSRVSEFLFGTDSVIYYDSTLIPRVIQSFFMPSDPPASPNLFSSEYGKWASIGGYLPLFSMAGVIAFMKSRRKHWATRMTLLCIICAFIPILNSLFQAANSYYYARWFYMPILIMSMMTAQALDDPETDCMPGVKICAAVVAALALIGLYPTKGKDDKVELFRLPDDVLYFWIQIAVAAVLLICALIVFIMKKKGKPFRTAALIMTPFAAIICFYTTAIYGAVTPMNAHKYIKTVIEHENEVYEEVSSDNFFRIDISEGCDNYSMAWGLPNMRAFQSVVETSIMDFYSSIGVDRSVASRAEVSHYTLRGLLSVKYYYKEITPGKRYNDLLSMDRSSDSSETKSAEEDTEDLIIPEMMPGFEYAGEKGHFEIYENELYVPMGFGYDTFISQDDADEKSNMMREKLMMKSIVLDDEQIEKYSGILSEYDPTENCGMTKKSYMSFCEEKRQNCSSSFSYDSSGFRSEISLEKPELVFFSVPYSKGWTAEVNGKSAEVERVSYGFMAVKADEGDNTIVFRYRTPGLTGGLIISGAGVLLLAGYLVLCRIFRKKSDNDYAPHVHYYDYY